LTKWVWEDNFSTKNGYKASEWIILKVFLGSGKEEFKAGNL
jgi:hypothetical protein